MAGKLAIVFAKARKAVNIGCANQGVRRFLQGEPGMAFLGWLEGIVGLAAEKPLQLAQPGAVSYGSVSLGIEHVGCAHEIEQSRFHAVERPGNGFLTISAAEGSSASAICPLPGEFVYLGDEIDALGTYQIG